MANSITATNSRPWGRAAAAWLLLMVVETAHGAVRTWWIAPWLGDLGARQVGVFSGSVLVLAGTYLLSGWLRVQDTYGRLRVGLLWVGLTVVFEIALGRALGYEWSQILSDYDLKRGRLMPLGLIAMLVAPWVAARLHGARTGNSSLL